MSTKTELLQEIIEPIVESFELELWGLQFLPQGNHAILRIYIDSEKGVDVEDCARVSRQLSAVLDVEDPISSRYSLEVSSPGLDRFFFKLEQYKRYIGSKISVKLNRAIDSKRKFKAQLLAVDEQKQILEFMLDDQKFDVDFLNIDKANLVGELP